MKNYLSCLLALFAILIYGISCFAEPSVHRTGWSYPLDDVCENNNCKKPNENVSFGFMSYNNASYPYHYAQDFTYGYKEGDPVYAMADGKIVRVRKSGGYGGGSPCNSDYNTLVVEHKYIKKDGTHRKVYVFYGHVKDILDVPPDATKKEVITDIYVRKGQKIGELNNPACAGWTVKHLHLSVMPDELASDYYAGYNSVQEKNGRARPFDLWNNPRKNHAWTSDWVDSAKKQDENDKDEAFFDTYRPVTIKIDSVIDNEFKIKGAYFGDKYGTVEIYRNTSGLETVSSSIEAWSSSSITVKILSLHSDSILLKVENNSGKLIADLYYPFQDVELDKWYAEAVTSLWKRGIIHGKSPGFYMPSENSNFAEFLTILVGTDPNLNAAQCQEGDIPFPINTSTADFPPYSEEENGGPWYCKYYKEDSIQKWVEELRYLDSSRGWPGQEIKRKEVAFFLAKATETNLYDGISGFSDLYGYGGISGFSDVDNDDNFAPYIKKCKKRGIFCGYEDGTFKPEKEINRAEIAKVLYEAFFDK